MNAAIQYQSSLCELGAASGSHRDTLRATHCGSHNCELTGAPLITRHLLYFFDICPRLGEGMPRGVAKANLPTKTCVVCLRPFTWRKVWERCWDEVQTCSDRCVGHAGTDWLMNDMPNHTLAPKYTSMLETSLHVITSRHTHTHTHCRCKSERKKARSAEARAQRGSPPPLVVMPPPSKRDE